MLLEFVNEMDFREVYNFVCLNSFLVDRNELERIEKAPFENEIEYVIDRDAERVDDSDDLSSSVDDDVSIDQSADAESKKSQE